MSACQGPSSELRTYQTCQVTLELKLNMVHHIRSPLSRHNQCSRELESRTRSALRGVGTIKTRSTVALRATVIQALEVSENACRTVYFS